MLNRPATKIELTLEEELLEYEENKNIRKKMINNNQIEEEILVEAGFKPTAVDFSGGINEELNKDYFFKGSDDKISSIDIYN